MAVIRFVLLAAAVACLFLAALEVKAPRVDLTALGLMCLALSLLLGVRE